MTRQGAVAHWLYLIVRGSARVYLDTPAGRVDVAIAGGKHQSGIAVPHPCVHISAAGGQSPDHRRVTGPRGHGQSGDVFLRPGVYVRPGVDQNPHRV